VCVYPVPQVSISHIRLHRLYRNSLASRLPGPYPTGNFIITPPETAGMEAVVRVQHTTESYPQHHIFRSTTPSGYPRSALTRTPVYSHHSAGDNANRVSFITFPILSSSSNSLSKISCLLLSHRASPTTSLRLRLAFVSHPAHPHQDQNMSHPLHTQPPSKFLLPGSPICPAPTPSTSMDAHRGAAFKMTGRCNVPPFLCSRPRAIVGLWCRTCRRREPRNDPLQ
jgi:hypothetical protein